MKRINPIVCIYITLAVLGLSPFAMAGLETGTYIDSLVTTNPTSSDPKSQGDDHLRLVKSTVTSTFPNLTGAVTPTQVELNHVDGVTSAIQTQINTKAPTASPTFTGEIGIGSVNVSETELGILEGATLTTAELNILDGVTSTTAEINYVDGVTSAIQTQINTKAPTANPTFTGEIGIGSVNISETELGILEGAILTTAEINYVDGVTSAIQTQINTKAPTASPTLTGTPAAPTASAGTSTTQLATTAFVESKSVLQTKIMNIGDWDMDTDSTKSVAHGVTFANIRMIDVMIRNDLDNQLFRLDYASNSNIVNGSFYVSSTQLVMGVYSAGSFDSVNFDSTSYNRGWIMIQYVN